MKTMGYLLAVSAALLLASCATTFRPWKLSEVQEGMERAQVLRILGEPDLAVMKDGAEYLRYTYREDYNLPVVPHEADASRAMQDLDVGRNFKEYTYEVMLIDGKVLNYKELGN